MWKSTTVLIILIVVLGLVLYDFAVCMFGDNATISELLGVYLTVEAHPMMVFLFGFGMGVLANHFMGWKPDKDWKRGGSGG